MIGTKQPAISRAEQADYENWNLNTIRMIADALDARVRVLIEPFEDILSEYEESNTEENSDVVASATNLMVSSWNEIHPVSTGLLQTSLMLPMVLAGFPAVSNNLDPRWGNYLSVTQKLTAPQPVGANEQKIKQLEAALEEERRTAQTLRLENERLRLARGLQLDETQVRYQSQFSATSGRLPPMRQSQEQPANSVFALLGSSPA